MKYPLTRPKLGDPELSAIEDAFRDGWVTQGPRVSEFEKRVAEYVGTNHCIATNSGTSALQLALLALGVGAGDEVIVPAFTWIATANAVEATGGTAVFCDVSLDTLNIRASQIEAHITPNTVALMPVHLFGLCADMETIGDISARHGLPIIEDAACAIGATHKARQAGQLGDIGCFSFHPRKTITTGEGGMVCTESGALADTILSLRNHGMDVSANRSSTGGESGRQRDFTRVGFNYRMSDINAAVGCVQMTRLPELLSHRRELAGCYRSLLSEIDWIRLQEVLPEDEHSYQSFVVLVAAEEPSAGNLQKLRDCRDSLIARLAQHGIESGPGTHAPVRLGVYRDRKPDDRWRYSNAVIAASLSLALPLSPEMTPSDVMHIVDVLEQCYESL